MALCNSLVRNVSCGSVNSLVLRSQVRNMATLREIKNRMKSVQSVRKITNTMKTVAASRLKAAETLKDTAVPFGHTASSGFGSYDLPAEQNKHVVVVIATDRGLCGAVNSSVIRKTREVVRNLPPGSVDLICIGEKSKSVLSREFAPLIKLFVTGLDRKPLAFYDLSFLAEEITRREYDTIHFVRNEWVNALSFNTHEFKYPSLQRVLTDEKFPEIWFDSDDEGVTVTDFYSFWLTSMLYSALVENAAVELASRRAAMDGAAKNAADMIRSLTLAFNRKRQAIITNELIEIISGAEGLQVSDINQ